MANAHPLPDTPIEWMCGPAQDLSTEARDGYFLPAETGTDRTTLENDITGLFSWRSGM